MKSDRKSQSIKKESQSPYSIENAPNRASHSSFDTKVTDDNSVSKDVPSQRSTTNGQKVPSSVKLLKRPSIRPATLGNDMYISRKTKKKAVLVRTRKLLESKRFDHVTIHGLGAMVPKAIDLALTFQRDTLPECNMTVRTSSVTLIDEILPEDKDEESQLQKRMNSAVHIQISLK